MIPPVERVKPVGKLLPEASAHMYGLVPPPATSCVEGYRLLTVPPGRLAVVMNNGAITVNSVERPDSVPPHVREYV